MRDAVDTTLHVIDPGRPKRTLCGLRCERGVHRCGLRFLQAHIVGRGAIACETCERLAATS